MKEGRKEGREVKDIYLCIDNILPHKLILLLALFK
jgi:hypothetical protein